MNLDLLRVEVVVKLLYQVFKLSVVRFKLCVLLLGLVELDLESVKVVSQVFKVARLHPDQVLGAS